jgi:hypothetical protein
VVLASDQASISRHLLTEVGENDHNSQFMLDDMLSFQIQSFPYDRIRKSQYTNNLGGTMLVGTESWLDITILEVCH